MPNDFRSSALPRARQSSSKSPSTSDHSFPVYSHPRYLTPSPPQSRPQSNNNSPTPLAAPSPVSVHLSLPPPSLRPGVPTNGSPPSRPPSRQISISQTTRTSGFPSPQLSNKDTSHLSLARSEGEDDDSYLVRSTYAQLDVLGVKGDGYDEGVERTRARIGSSRASEIIAENALADEEERRRELSAQELEMLASLDRYGFFTGPNHDRLVLLPSAALAKPLALMTTAITTSTPTAQALSSLPSPAPPIHEAERMEKWGRMLQPKQRDPGGNIESWGVHAAKTHKLRRRVYKGIPDRWRSAAWAALMRDFAKSGARDIGLLAEEYRTNLERPSTFDVQIDLDVPRTISGHILFKTRYGLGQRSLFHVLHSFSLRCESCGYCQGMGPIAAMLLCYFAPERAYACLVYLHDAYQMHTIFSPGFPGLLESIYVQERVMAQIMPPVYAAFKKHMISTTSYATKWYITLFANSVPFQTSLRLWDAFLLEGPDLFIVMALAVIWGYRDLLTAEAANFETVLSLLSSFFVPEDENALMSWISGVLEDKKLRADMKSWREEWKALVAAGKEGDALL
ncbi:rab-GTPase-TBC domain-containing protein [Amylostereum chailletii]|nr:rab-GTPase-TBC domain-containing protein [Amylostereum chailletii]